MRPDVVCVVASAGGVAAHRALLSALPPDLPAAVVVVQHRPAGPVDLLPEVLAASSSLPVEVLADGHALRPGTVHVVPPSAAVAVGPDGRVALTTGVAHNADPLLVSAAAAFGPRVVAVVLTGRLDDGALGVRHVKGAGGRVLVQDPAGCTAPQMPAAALVTGCVDHVLPLPVLADAVTALVLVPGAGGMMRVALPTWATPVLPAPAAPVGPAVLARPAPPRARVVPEVRTEGVATHA